MHKRLVVFYCLMLCVAAGLFFRLYYLTAGDALRTVAETQSSYTLDVLKERGIIYDRSFKRMTNTEESYVAAVLPCPESLSALSKVLTGEKRDQMIASFQDNRPFLIEVDTPDIYAYGVDVFRTTRRYSDSQPAAHIIGHLQGDTGAYGIEKSYDDILSVCGSRVAIRYTVDAHNEPLHNVAPDIREQYSEQGVVLTLDLDIQRLAEELAPYYIEKGAVVVMDIETGDILAAVSLPSFSPNDVSAALDDPDQPFVNRFSSAYNVGSTFKLLVAACALDSGISQELGYDCTGLTDIDGLVIHCHNLAGHGWLTMRRAVEQSCNPYFIHLGLKLDPEPYLALCQAVGFGRQTKLAPQMTTAAGSLPTLAQLQSRGELANFSFGQGALTATPLQIAQLISTIANGGKAVTPRLVLGATLDGETVAESNPNADPIQVISPDTAALVRDMMISTVEVGSGRNAKPDFGSAGGKTGSAQTGLYHESGPEKGEEIVHAWFSGFYPAKDPRYAIVVLNEGGNTGGIAAAPLFRGISDGIHELERERK